MKNEIDLFDETQTGFAPEKKERKKREMKKKKVEEYISDYAEMQRPVSKYAHYESINMQFAEWFETFSEPQRTKLLKEIEEEEKELNKGKTVEDFFEMKEVPDSLITEMAKIKRELEIEAREKRKAAMIKRQEMLIAWKKENGIYVEPTDGKKRGRKSKLELLKDENAEINEYGQIIIPEEIEEEV